MLQHNVLFIHLNIFKYLYDVKIIGLMHILCTVDIILAVTSVLTINKLLDT